MSRHFCVYQGLSDQGNANHQSVITLFGWSIVADSNPGSLTDLQILLIPFQTALTALALSAQLFLSAANFLHYFVSREIVIVRTQLG
jgi:hypothetical protein